MQRYFITDTDFTSRDAAGIPTGRPGFDSRQGQTREFSLLHSFQTGSGAPHSLLSDGYRGVKRQAGGAKLTTLLHLVPRSGMVEVYLNSPIRPPGLARNLLNTRQLYVLLTLEPEIYEFIRDTAYSRIYHGKDYTYCHV
jgi:hypothetical protein